MAILIQIHTWHNLFHPNQFLQILNWDYDLNSDPEIPSAWADYNTQHPWHEDQGLSWHILIPTQFCAN